MIIVLFIKYKKIYLPIAKFVNLINIMVYLE